jgi:hypothetical protein
MRKHLYLTLVLLLSACESQGVPQPASRRCDTFKGFAPAVSYTTANEPFTLVAVDVTGGGRSDLIVGERSSSGPTSEHMINHGDGTFVLSALYGASGNNARNMMAADFSGDGTADLVSQSNGATSSGLQDLSLGEGVLGLDLGLGNGTFASQLVTYATAETSGSLAVGDFDGDGRPDVAFAGFDYVESGGAVGQGIAVPAPEPADYGLNIFLNAGGGAFAPPATYANPQPFQSIAPGDFDGDGHLDLVGLTWTNAPAFGVYFNAGDGTFGTETSFADGNGFGNYGLAVGDFDGDGKDDVAVITVLNPNQSNEDIVLELYTGAAGGSFDGPALMTIANIPSVYQLITGDFNGDGKPDLAMVMGHDATGALVNPIPVALFENQGDGTFGAPVMYTVGGADEAYAIAVAAADFNGDGVTDLAVTTEGETSPYPLAVNVLLSQCE